MKKRSRVSPETTTSRRRFLKAVPVAVAGGLTAPVLARQAQQEARLSKDVLDCAEKVAGLDFTDADQEQIVRGVNGNLERFETLRKIEVPLDTEPALTFRPYLPGRAPKPGATVGAKVKVALQAPAARQSSVKSMPMRSSAQPIASVLMRGGVCGCCCCARTRVEAPAASAAGKRRRKRRRDDMTTCAP